MYNISYKVYLSILYRINILLQIFFIYLMFYLFNFYLMCIYYKFLTTFLYVFTVGTLQIEPLLYFKTTVILKLFLRKYHNLYQWWTFGSRALEKIRMCMWKTAKISLEKTTINLSETNPDTWSSFLQDFSF